MRKQTFSISEILGEFDGNTHNTPLFNFVKRELIPKGIIEKRVEKSKYTRRVFTYYTVNEELLSRFIISNILNNILWDIITDYSLEKGKVIGKFTFPEPPEPI